MFRRKGSVEDASENVDVDNFDDEMDSDLETDPELRTRISLVESKLMDLVAQIRLAGQEHGGDKADVSGTKTRALPNLYVPTDLPIHAPHAYPCADTYKILPAPPTKWPQAPLMLRPTPGAPMRIRGIRYAHSKAYQHFGGFCAGCILPINTGKEAAGKSLVIDFESPTFVGTLLMRIRDTKPADTTAEQSSSSSSYFDGKKRKFQAIVKGKFKKPLPINECVTGQIFDRPAGKLPASLIVNSFIRFVSVLAPQMEATLEGDRPRFLTPLVATAQTASTKPHKSASPTAFEPQSETEDKLVNFAIYAGSSDMEDDIAEPCPTNSTSLLQALTTGKREKKIDTVTTRMKHRKKVFNQGAANKATTPTFDLDQEYTFEFYQHLLIFTDDADLQLDMGRALGKHGLARALNGQPLKFVAAHRDPAADSLATLWSFDIWHSVLYGYAEQFMS
eukprot:scaffold5385_cov152-Amphora_coffeaeformis.AAC.4